MTGGFKNRLTRYAWRLAKKQKRIQRLFAPLHLCYKFASGGTLEHPFTFVPEQLDLYKLDPLRVKKVRWVSKYNLFGWDAIDQDQIPGYKLGV